MQKHGGDIFSYKESFGKEPIADFSANISPLGMSFKAKEAISAILQSEDAFSRYPDPESRALRAALGKKYGLPSQNIVCGAGAADIIFRIARAFRAEKAIIAEPAFSEYRAALEKCGTREIKSVFALESDGFLLKTVPDTAETGIFFVCTPSNPAGAVLSEEFLCELAKKCEKTGTILVIDACFCQFDAESDAAIKSICKKMADECIKNTIILGAFTKFYGLAGLRAGFALCSSEKIAKMIFSEGTPWALSSVAEAAATAALKDFDYEKEVLETVSAEKKYLLEELKKIGIKKVWGRANFLLFRSHIELSARLLKRGLMIRDCSDFRGLGAGFFRIAVKNHRENELLVRALKAEIAEKPPCRFIMVQGTMSNAGKSFLVAALCRIFREDGLKVAPFKAQNMALNSAVGADGGELGRAQAMQAEAAGILADSRMNPVLLKPTGAKTSQVIVNGKAIGEMTATEFFRKKQDFMPIVLKNLESLAAENDIIVIEGAGSPAEINLKENDIVNMALAKKIGAGVILVSDIDRGGVFAQLFGTVSLLESDEKALIKALVINKFRGDVSLLASGIEKIENLTGKKVLGIVPMLKISLDDEDSLAERLNTKGKKGAPIKIAVIKLPHISNFTDFAPFERRNDCDLRYFAEKSSLEAFSPHFIIIPGTKNTIDDLIFLKNSGIFDSILDFYAKNIPIAGICGGFQMMGSEICDFEGVESPVSRMESALGIFGGKTEMKKQKTLSRTRGITPNFSGFFSCIAQKSYSGYEIHSGISDFAKDFPAIAEKNAFGTYFHGFFDSDDVSSAIIESICAKFDIKCDENAKIQPYSEWKESQYSALSAAVRSALDVNEIYKIAGF